MEYAERHHPVTVRQLFYAATVHFDNVPKTEEGYGKIQRRVKTLRMEQTMPMHWIADYSRSVWGVDAYASPSNALRDYSSNYYFDFWNDRDETVEIWLEKSALAGVLAPITTRYQVTSAHPLDNLRSRSWNLPFDVLQRTVSTGSSHTRSTTLMRLEGLPHRRCQGV